MIWHSTFQAGKVLQMLNNRYGPLWGKYRPMITESKPAAHHQLPSKSYCVCGCSVYHPVNNQSIPGKWKNRIFSYMPLNTAQHKCQYGSDHDMQQKQPVLNWRHSIRGTKRPLERIYRKTGSLTFIFAQHCGVCRFTFVPVGHGSVWHCLQIQNSKPFSSDWLKSKPAMDSIIRCPGVFSAGQLFLRKSNERERLG